MPTKNCPEVLSDFFQEFLPLIPLVIPPVVPSGLSLGAISETFPEFSPEIISLVFTEISPRNSPEFLLKGFLVKVSKIISGILPKISRHSLSDSLETSCRDSACVHLRNSFRYYFSNSREIP